MKTIKLVNSDSVALVDDDLFEILNQFEWRLSSNGYVYRCVNTRCVLLHRTILYLSTPDMSKNKYGDHENRNKLDNQKKNLRVATGSQSLCNRGRMSNNTSGYKGVVRKGTKWSASATFNGKTTYIGVFSTREEAARAYDDNIIARVGEFAQLNFPKET